jgi:hypothetical protein
MLSVVPPPSALDLLVQRLMTAVPASLTTAPKSATTYLCARLATASMSSALRVWRLRKQDVEDRGTGGYVGSSCIEKTRE